MAEQLQTTSYHAVTGSHLEITGKGLLGEGRHGAVRLGRYYGKPVAVKSLLEAVQNDQCDESLPLPQKDLQARIILIEGELSYTACCISPPLCRSTDCAEQARRRPPSSWSCSTSRSQIV